MNKAFTYKKLNFKNSTPVRVRGLFVIQISLKVIVTRVKVAFFYSIDKSLEFDSARQVPPPTTKKFFAQILSNLSLLKECSNLAGDFSTSL